MKLKLLKAAGMIGALTLLSRVLGMIRDILSANSFGTTWQWDAFIYAFMLPNFMRRLVGEGALLSAFIPVYTQIVEKEGKEPAFRFANTVFTFLFWTLVGFLILIELALLILVRIPSLPPVVMLTCKLLTLLFPYLFFISFCALATAILNSHHHFFSASLSPIILDLVWIGGVFAAMTWGGPRSESRVFMLSLFIFFSGAIQLGVQVPSLLRLGYTPRFHFDFSHPGLLQIGKLILPSILGFAIIQINILVDMTLGFWVGPGANSSLWYGNRLMQFPLGVFAIAMGTALLPAISQHTARKEIEEAKKALAFALRSVFFIILPATVGLIVLRAPIVQLLFERGEFDAVSTARTSFVVLGYTLGLFAYSGQKVVVTGFYSLQDTKTPVKVGALTLLLNIIFNLILMGPFKEGGLALATSIAGIVNFSLLLYLYNLRTLKFPIQEVLVSSFKILMASLVMGVFAWFIYAGIFPITRGGMTFRLLASVFGSMGISGLIYIGLCFLFRVSEIQDAVRWLVSRKDIKSLEPLGDEPL